MKSKIFSILFTLVLVCSFSLMAAIPAMAEDEAPPTLTFGGGAVNGGASVILGTGLSVDSSKMYWFEVVGIDTSSLLPTDTFGGFRLRINQADHAPVGPNDSTGVNLGVQARTYPDSFIDHAGGNPLIQTVEWTEDLGGEWMNPTHSHGFNPDDVTAKYDLRWEMVQTVGGDDDGKWTITPQFRLTSGTGDWTDIYDGSQVTRYAYTFDDATLIVEAGDGFSGGNATYDNICTNALVVEVWVDDDWAELTPGDLANGHTFGYDAFATIQDGINAVSDAINVAAGTYTENVNITTSLTLNGAGSGSDPASNTVITAAAAGVPVVRINASGASASDRLTLSNIHVTDGNGTGTYENSGIKFVTGGSYTTFSNVASVDNEGSGLLARAGTLQDVQILNCTFSNNGGSGFLASGSTLSSVADLTITDTDMNNNITAGLYIDAALDGLTLTGGHYDDNYGSSTTATNGLGMYFTGLGVSRDTPTTVPKPIVLSGFTADNNVRGIIINKFYGPFSVTDASVSNNLEEGITVAPGADVTDPITFRNVTVSNNLKSNLWVISYLGYTVSNMAIDECTFNGSNGIGGYGLWLDVFANSATVSTLSNVAVTNCTMMGNNTGIYLNARSVSDKPTGVLTGVSITGSAIENNGTGIIISDNATAGNNAHQNNIAGNSVIGIQNNNPNNTFDAKYNWWGDKTGPKQTDSNPDGKGDEVSANVEYQPWFTKVSEDVLAEGVGYYGYTTDRLGTGWNILSTPFALDSDCDTWGKFVTLNELSGKLYTGEQEVYANAYYYDSASQDWGQVTSSYQLKPCDAIYVKMAQPDIAAVLASPGLSTPQKTLRRGWNLVGLSWQPTEGQESVAKASDYLKTVETVGTLPGYTLVVSPSQNQEAWTYVVGGTIEPWEDETLNPGWMTPTKGYWVIMENGPDVLYGTWMTPMGLPSLDR